MKQGIDYKEKYASTAHWTTHMILLTVAATNDYDLTLFDIKTFFLYGELPEDEQIYMEQIPGREVEGKEDYVHRLLSAIYGHPAADYHAQVKLRNCLESAGFR